MGLREIFNASWEGVGTFLQNQYIANPLESARRAEAQKRDELYEKKGDRYIRALVDIAFKDKLTNELRADLISWAKWNNFIGRVINEKATVYSAPARRHVSKDDATYQQFCERISIDSVMREVNRLLVLHEDVWIQYRVRQSPRMTKDAAGEAVAEREPVVDIVSPSSFWAIAHPRDRTMLIGIILDQRTPDAKPTDPAFRVWTDDETFMLDGESRVISTSVEPWPLGRMPGVLASLRIPGTKVGLLAECPNADLVAAHEAIWFQNLLLLKESKSANRSTYASGDMAQATLGQSADTERETFVPEGTTITSIDRGLDLSQFRDNASAIADDAGANHGLPPTVRRQADATSGAEIYLRRIPLSELRIEQIPTMRRVELALVMVFAMVNKDDLPNFSFDASEWSMDFGEIQQPLTEAERDQVFEKRRQLLLTDTLEELMRRNPDLKTPEAADAELMTHISREVVRVVATQALQRLNGGTSSAPGDPTPQDNGATGQAAAASPAPAAAKPGQAA
jgi:hypothetical protein